MNNSILKYIFVDFIDVVLLIIGALVGIILFKVLPKFYYLNLIITGVYFLLIIIFYLPWVRSVEKNLFKTLNLDESQKFSYFFHLVILVMFIYYLIKGEYLISGLLSLIILLGIFRYNQLKKEKPTGDTIYVS